MSSSAEIPITVSEIVVASGAWPYRVGCVSDTHLPGPPRSLPAALLRALAGVDLILHAGDLVDETVLDELGSVAPVLAVAGNVDPAPLAGRLPRARLIRIGRPEHDAPWRIGLVHGDSGVGASTPDRALSVFTSADVVVFGHSHQPLCDEHQGVVRLNPGSPTAHRFAPWPSYGLLTLPDPYHPGDRPEAKIKRLRE